MTRTIKPTKEQQKNRKHRHRKSRLREQDYTIENGGDNMVGYVKKWTDRGFGFVKGQDGNDYFVHYTNILKDGFKSLTEGVDVEFDIDETGNKPQAINVKEIN